MDISPLVGVDRTADADYNLLGRARSLKAIAALILIVSVSALLSTLLSLVAQLASSGSDKALLGVDVAIVIGGVLYEAAMCAAAVCLWKLRPIGLLAVLGWAVSLLVSTYYLWSSQQGEGEQALGSPSLDSITAVLAAFFAALAAYLIWLLVSPKTRAVVFNKDSGWLQQESRLAGTTIVALVVIGLFVALGFAGEMVAIFT